MKTDEGEIEREFSLREARIIDSDDYFILHNDN